MTNATNVISMDNRRQYSYLSGNESTQGVIGTWKGYEGQIVSLQPGDVLLVHISDDMDLYSCKDIMQTLKETFPNNQCILCNEHVLKGLTIIRAAENKKVDDVVDISTNVDVDKLFEEIMKGNPNDFLLSGQNLLR